jgi:hypothetical protein
MNHRGHKDKKNLKRIPRNPSRPPFFKGRRGGFPLGKRGMKGDLWMFLAILEPFA